MAIFSPKIDTKTCLLMSQFYEQHNSLIPNVNFILVDEPKKEVSKSVQAIPEAQVKDSPSNVSHFSDKAQTDVPTPPDTNIPRAQNNISHESDVVDYLEQIIKNTVKNTVKDSLKTHFRVSWQSALIVGILLSSLIINMLLFSEKQISNQFASSEVKGSTEVVSSNQSPLISEKDQVTITEFFDNNILADIGAKINVQKNAIASQDNRNCQTSVIPPNVNGCSFVIIPQQLNLNSKGVLFKSIQFQADLPDDGVIQIDTKNYDTSEIRGFVGTVDKNTPNQKITLTDFLKPTQGLYIRLWSKNGGIIKIKKLILGFYNLEDLKEVKLPVSSEQAQVFAKGVTVYRDTDENGQFDPKLDKKWDCQSNFPGIKPIQIINSEIQLERDDSCLQIDKPNSWLSDGGKLTLPAGKWLLVNENLQKNIPLEV